MINSIIDELNNTKGLNNVQLLKEEDIDIIRNLEEENNEGVFSCLDKEFTLMVTHDSSFREPAGEIVKEQNGNVMFPGVAFPEIKAKEVVSSSPKKEVHDYLTKKFNLFLKDEATLLIGLNL